jgi:hypothetical protein
MSCPAYARCKVRDHNNLINPKAMDGRSTAPRSISSALRKATHNRAVAGSNEQRKAAKELPGAVSHFCFA